MYIFHTKHKVEYVNFALFDEASRLLGIQSEIENSYFQLSCDSLNFKARVSYNIAPFFSNCGVGENNHMAIAPLA